jgi:hypothetical protein
MRNASALFILIVAAGCAATPGAPGGAPQVATITGQTELPGVEVHLRQSVEIERGAATTFAAPAERVRQEVVNAYDALGIAIGTLDTQAGLVGNRNLVINNGRLGQERLSVYVNCGNAEFGGLAADRYRVTLSVITQVAAAGANQTEVRSWVEGTAVNQRSGQTRAPNACLSTKELERRISQRVASRIGG